MPCSKTIKKLTLEKYEVKKKGIAVFFKSISAFALTFDEWTSIANSNYLIITSHHLNSCLNMEEKVLCFINISGKSKSHSLSKVIEDTITYFGINDKIISITTDNAANVLKSKELLTNVSYKGKKTFNIRCIAHCLNLIVKSALKNFEETLSILRVFISNFKKSPKKIVELEEMCKFKGVKFNKLKIDCPTRWNSTLTMINRYFFKFIAVSIFFLKCAKFRKPY